MKKVRVIFSPEAEEIFKYWQSNYIIGKTIKNDEHEKSKYRRENFGVVFAGFY